MREKIICPHCGSIETAVINKTPLWNDYTHLCGNCGYWITESEWEPAKHYKREASDEFGIRVR